MVFFCFGVEVFECNFGSALRLFLVQDSQSREVVLSFVSVVVCCCLDTHQWDPNSLSSSQCCLGHECLCSLECKRDLDSTPLGSRSKPKVGH